MCDNEVKSAAKFKVLIVDDKPENLEVLDKNLCRRGALVSSAASGRQALELVAADPPDLILLDISMPEMNGLEVCKKLKEDPATKDIPIIFITARAQPEDIVKGFEAGAVDYVTKPFYSSELISRVFTHLELKRARDTINKQNAELKHLNDGKDRFFSIIAHDMRNPFSILMGFSNILHMRYDTMNDAKRKEYIAVLNTTCERVVNFLENLLKWGRVQLNKLEINPQKISLKKIFDDNILLLKENANQKNIELKTEISGECYAYADHEMIDLVVRNLISNALKFTGSGGIILLEARITEESTEVKVSDNGVGINETDMKKLFRIDGNHTTTGTANERGTGLGLILCREFIEKNGGKIRVESKPDIGSAFIFTIPKQ
jgi:signal transduction histidine kinase